MTNKRQTLNPEMIEEIKAIAGEKNAKLLEKMIKSYLDDVNPLIEKVKEAIESHEGHRLSEDAHALKSTSVTVGAEKLSDLALELELKGKDEQFDDLGATVSELEAEAERVKIALQKYLD